MVGKVFTVIKESGLPNMLENSHKNVVWSMVLVNILLNLSRVYVDIFGI